MRSGFFVGSVEPMMISNASMSKKVVLVGHCGADASYLRLAIRSADPMAQVVAANDQEQLKRVLEQGIDLVLFNRELGYGFDDDTGIEAIRLLRLRDPQLKLMLISNYPDAQSAAVAA